MGMKELSKRVLELFPSPTLSISAKARELRKRGERVIGFGAGEPDLKPPEILKECVIRALKEGHDKYLPSAGIRELRELLSYSYQRRGVNYGPEDLVITGGAKLGIFLVLLALIEEGDEVLIPSPYWVSYPVMVKLCGGIPKFIDLKEEEGFKLTYEKFLEKVSPKTKLLIVNSPNNPTGALYDREELLKIVGFCKERGIWVLSDECYENFVYEGDFFNLAKGFEENVITVSSFSKSFSVTGWRLGYIGAKGEIVKKLLSLNSQTLSNATSFLQYAFYYFLKEEEEVKKYLEEVKRTFKRRRDLVVSLLSEIEGISFVKPEGAFYVFPDLSRYYEDDLTLSELLLEKEKVALVPGTPFGARGRVRITFALPEDEIREGVGRIASFLLDGGGKGSL